MKRETTRRIVSKKVIKGYWDCPYCNSKDLDGLVDYCPNCGVHKPKDTKYHLNKSKTVEVSKEELKKAGIEVGHNDGEHPEWACDYCGSLNNYLDTTCSSCGSLKSESKSDYFTQDNSENDLIGSDKIDEKYEKNEDNISEKIGYTDRSYNSYNSYNSYGSSYSIKSDTFHYIDKKKLFIASMVVLLGAIIMFLFAPYKETTLVNGFSWDRTIFIEEEKTFKEDGWSVPSGGRVYDKKIELYGYDKVLDHYDKVEVQKTREVFSHYEYDYETEYEDNGDGTFNQVTVEVKTPVYVEETYTEIEEIPVYIDVPVYETKYYYEIDRWVTEYKSESHGNDKNPYWNEKYTLGLKQRDSRKDENYYIHYDNEDKLKVEIEEWNNTNINDKVVLTKCRLGFVYKQEKVKRSAM